MEQWVISFYGRVCEPELIEARFKQDHPTLSFKHEDKDFSVEFENRSDYYSAAYHTEVKVKVINGQRTKYYEGTAVNVKK